MNDSSNGTWTYTYDDFNRLMGSSCSSHCPDGEGTQGFSYTYDRYANRWTQTVTAGSGGTSNLSFTGNNNHIDGYSYDAAGNLMSDGQHTYYYDAEHELIQVDGTEGWCASNTGTAATACYTYDGEGQRVRRTVPGSGITDDYLYDLSGTYITQISGGGVWIRGEIYAGGRHLGTYENDLSTPTTFFTHADWLGTERVETAVNGTSCESIVSVAFGDGLSTSGSCDPSAKYYTGKERDWESNLDNFEARYYSSQLGRFMSADWSAVPAPVPYATFTNPQTLNLYAIVSDNPETFADLNGHSPQQDCLVDVCQSGVVDEMNGPVGEPNTGDGTQQSDSQQATGAAAAQQQSDQQNQAQQQNLAGTIYNETGSLRPEVGNNGKTDPASATSLSDAREAVGEIVLNREAAGKTGGVAPSAVSKLGKATSQYADSLAAAKAAIAVGGSKTGPQHYYFRSGGLTIIKGKVTAGDQPSWGRGVVPSASYGPFRNPVKAGDVAAGSNIYVDIYHVP